MKYTVKFACGHKAMIELDGPTKDRERKIAYYKQSGICPACYAAKVAAKNRTGCEEIEMHYADYKSKRFWCKTARDSYNAKTKTIKVYVPTTYTGLEGYIDRMASNRNGDDGLRANCQIIRDALDNNEITTDQSKVLVKAAKEIRYF